MVFWSILMVGWEGAMIRNWDPFAAHARYCYTRSPRKRQRLGKFLSAPFLISSFAYFFSAVLNRARCSLESSFELHRRVSEALESSSKGGKQSKRSVRFTKQESGIFIYIYAIKNQTNKKWDPHSTPIPYSFRLLASDFQPFDPHPKQRETSTVFLLH